jgi:hypothetical protein
MSTRTTACSLFRQPRCNMNNLLTSIARQSTNLMGSSRNPLLRLVLLAGLLLAVQSVALGGTLTVTVLRQKGNASVPLAGAQVCISGNFGTQSATTNNSGTATFPNAPQGQLTLIASASGFLGQSIQFTMGAADKTQSFLLQLGSGGPICNPALPPPPVTLSSLVLNPTSVNGGTASQGTVALSAAAPPGGAAVSLSSNNTSAATVPPSVPVSAGSTSATFTISTIQVSSSKTVIITASAGGTTRTATLTVNATPPPPPPPPPPATANLTVLVGRANSTAISGAAVCVAAGTGAAQAAETDLGGQVTFHDVPQGQVTITVSSSGFTGQSHTSTLPAGGGTARFILSAGSGGPVCNAPPPPAATGPPVITLFDWHVNRETPLFFRQQRRHRVVGY